MEEQILLKVPPALARYIHTLLQTDSIEQQQIDLTFLSTGEKKRNVQLNIANATNNNDIQPHYLGVLTDLPTTIETFKTFDGGNYYKAADISQMIVIPDAQSNTKKSSDNIADSKNASDVTATAAVKLPPVTYHSGITPPTQQIYPRRYNRIAKPPRDSVEAVEERLKNIQTGTYVEKYEIVEEVVEVPLEPGEEVPDDELNRPTVEDGFARPMAPVTAAAAKQPPPAQRPAAAANEWEDEADDTASETTNDEAMSTGLRSTVSSDAGRTPLQSGTPALRMGAQTPTLHDDNLTNKSATPRSTLRRQAMSTPTLPSPDLFADPAMGSPTMAQYDTDNSSFTRNAALAQSPSTMRSIDDFNPMDSTGMDLDAEIGGMLQLHAHTGNHDSNDYFDSPTQQSRRM